MKLHSGTSAPQLGVLRPPASLPPAPDMLRYGAEFRRTNGHAE